MLVGAHAFQPGSTEGDIGAAAVFVPDGAEGQGLQLLECGEAAGEVAGDFQIAQSGGGFEEGEKECLERIARADVCLLAGNCFRGPSPETVRTGIGVGE